MRIIFLLKATLLRLHFRNEKIAQRLPFWLTKLEREARYLVSVVLEFHFPFAVGIDHPLVRYERYLRIVGFLELQEPEERDRSIVYNRQSSIFRSIE